MYEVSELDNGWQAVAPNDCCPHSLVITYSNLTTGLESDFRKRDNRRGLWTHIGSEKIKGDARDHCFEVLTNYLEEKGLEYELVK